jgi:hypothetical protein
MPLRQLLGRKGVEDERSRHITDNATRPAKLGVAKVIHFVVIFVIC